MTFKSERKNEPLWIISHFLLVIFVIIFEFWAIKTEAATVTINNNGAQCPIEGASGGLKIYVGDNSQFQVERCAANGTTPYSRQFYHSGTVPPSTAIYNSIYLRVGSTIFGAPSSGGVSGTTAWTAVSNTGGSSLGSGTTTTVYKGVVSTRTYTVTQTVSYVFPNDFYTIKLDVSVPAGNTADLKLYHRTDLQLDGDDYGQCIIDSSFPSFVGADNTARAYYAGYRQRSLASVWNRYFCGYWSDPLSYIGNTPYNLPNTATATTQNLDVGAAVQWNIGTVANTTFTAEYDFTFSVKIPSLTKRFGPVDGDNDHISSSGATIPLTFTLSNVPGYPAQGLIRFTDTLPSGVTVIGTPTSPQCGGTVTKGTSGGMDTITVNNAVLSGGMASCAITVNVTASAPGIYVNAPSNISNLNNLLNFANAKLTVLGVDYGDAPDTAVGVSVGNYNTTTADNGPRHALVTTPTLFLGSIAPDADSGTLQDTGASIDDTTDSPDDEDGITLPTAANLGQSLSVPVVINGSGYLNAWFDWNRDGDFLDTGEKIANDQNVATGTLNLNITVPATASIGQTYARFRLCSTTANCNAPSSASVATDGEVEDYPLTVTNATSLDISKTTSTPSINAGEMALYTITITNTGTLTATGIKITDTLANGFTYIDTSAISVNGVPLSADAYQILTTGTQTPSTPQWDTNPSGGFSINAGQSMVIQFRTGVAISVSDGIYNNSVSAISANTPTSFFQGEKNTEEDVTVIAAPFTVTGTVFKDSGTSGGTANNGIQDGVETGLAGVTVKLTDCGGITYSTASTNGTGGYSLPTTDVPTGTVCVEQSNLSGYISTGANVGGSITPVGYTRVSVDNISFTLVANTSYSGINFGDVPVNQFITDGTKTGNAGSTVLYPHTFVAKTGGTISFSLPGATASPALTGWTETLYTDSNCNGNLDSGETQTVTTAIPVLEGSQLCLILKEFIPASVPLGATNLATVKANFVYTNASPTLSSNYTRQDLTAVSDASLTLKKMVRNVTVDSSGSPNWQVNNTAKSGETLEYQISYTNNGATPISSLTIKDATPAYTSFVSALAGSFPGNLTNCTKTTPSSATAVLCSSVDTPGGTGGIEWKFTGSLLPGASGIVTFKVKLD